MSVSTVNSFELFLKTLSPPPVQVDMLVKDIYGGDYAKLGLPGDLIASSFGKAMKSSSGHAEPFRPDETDVARSLLFAISNDIGEET